MRMHNLHVELCVTRKKVNDLQKKLDKALMVDGIRVDDTINKDLLTIMNRQTGMAEEEKFSSIFGSSN